MHFFPKTEKAANCSLVKTNSLLYCLYYFIIELCQYRLPLFDNSLYFLNSLFHQDNFFISLPQFFL